MSRLRIYPDDAPGDVLWESADHAAIAAHLSERGIRFERWPLQAVPDGAAGDAVLAAYSAELRRLQQQGGYRSWDVISLRPDHPDRDALRRKFLAEHTHSEDEVRFFVAGSGLFSLHLGDRVYEVLCEQGDLIGVPDGTRHWFDMGPRPSFTAIRLFNNPEGWVASFTGTDIADRFPRYETA